MGIHLLPFGHWLMGWPMFKNHSELSSAAPLIEVILFHRLSTFLSPY
jgi:hypothetical protein